jgi:hypothetical protein
MGWATTGDQFASLNIESDIDYLGMLSTELTDTGSPIPDTWTKLTFTWNYLHLFLKMKGNFKYRTNLIKMYKAFCINTSTDIYRQKETNQ